MGKWALENLSKQNYFVKYWVAGGWVGVRAGLPHEPKQRALETVDLKCNLMLGGCGLYKH